MLGSFKPPCDTDGYSRGWFTAAEDSHIRHHSPGPGLQSPAEPDAESHRCPRPAAEPAALERLLVAHSVSIPGARTKGSFNCGSRYGENVMQLVIASGY